MVPNAQIHTRYCSTQYLYRHLHAVTVELGLGKAPGLFQAQIYTDGVSDTNGGHRRDIQQYIRGLHMHGSAIITEAKC